MSTPVWTRVVKGTVDWDRYPIGTMARESWAADVPDASPWVKGPDGWRSTRAPMAAPGSADEVLLPADDGINLDEVIRSMGWPLDDQEMDDMRRLCRAVLASGVRTPVFNTLRSVEPEVRRCSSLDPDDRTYDLVFKFTNEADLMAGYAEWLAQRSAMNSDHAVEYQFRVHYDENTVTPGWDRWKSCDEAKFNEINGYITLQRESMGRSVYETRLLYTSPDRRELLAAKDTLKALGYFFNGGVQWRPPLGPQPPLDTIEKLDDLCREFGCPPGINRFEFLRLKLRKAREAEAVDQPGWKPVDQLTGKGGALQSLHSQSYHCDGGDFNPCRFRLSIKPVLLLPIAATEHEFVLWIQDAIGIDPYGKVLVLPDDSRKLFPPNLPVWLRFSSLLAHNEGYTLTKGQLLDGFVVKSDTVCRVRL